MPVTTPFVSLPTGNSITECLRNSLSQSPIVRYGGNLYTVMMQFTGAAVGVTKSLQCWKSTDGGNTWTEADSAGAVSVEGWRACFDGLHTISCVTTIPTDGTDGYTPYFMRIVDFDLVTETWGSLSDPSPVPPHAALPADANGNSVGLLPLPVTISYGWFAYAPWEIFVRSNGSKVVLFSNVMGPGAGSHSNTWAVSFSSGTWGTPFEIDYAGVLIVSPVFGWTAGGPTYSCLDASDIIHTIYEVQPLDLSGERYFYQAILPNDTLGSFSELPDTTHWPQPANTAVLTPVCDSTSIYVPVQTGTAFDATQFSVYIGTPLSAPVWTLTTNIDSSIDLGSLDLMNGGAAAMVSGKPTIVFAVPPHSIIVDGFPNPPGVTPYVGGISIRQIVLSGGVWTPTTLFDLVSPSASNFIASPALNSDGDLSVSFYVGPDNLPAIFTPPDLALPSSTKLQRYFIPLSAGVTLAAAGKALTGGHPGIRWTGGPAHMHLVHGTPTKLIAGGIASAGKLLNGGPGPTLVFPTPCQQGGQPQVGPG
jgi:hypothetical protein